MTARVGTVSLCLVALLGCANDAESGASTSTSIAAGEPVGTVTYTDLDRSHVDTPVEYPQVPPVGGPHAAVWQTCGFYDGEFPKERGVHSMEHGAVWITFDPQRLTAADVDVLAELATAGKEVLVSPFTGLPSAIVASAWGKQLLVESVADPRLVEFVNYFDDGPQTPETFTPCVGGTTDTS